MTNRSQTTLTPEQVVFWMQRRINELEKAGDSPELEAMRECLRVYILERMP